MGGVKALPLHRLRESLQVLGRLFWFYISQSTAFPGVFCRNFLEAAIERKNIQRGDLLDEPGVGALKIRYPVAALIYGGLTSLG